ncbi:hypothetical protein [Novosphingobium pokkalii]|uniref:Uncharacterized protein n=1 Tax=Novosphingobium pokkalii TaxID=1770194 RepID=A0ABV7UZB5_9SPHN|nr:hypothetical protein [Novosphingobium pokkalii]GHC97243.1 hypothetical protein GCM10019060_27880 [Novosphingobium pokkalii]
MSVSSSIRRLRRKLSDILVAAEPAELGDLDAQLRAREHRLDPGSGFITAALLSLGLWLCLVLVWLAW